MENPIRLQFQDEEGGINDYYKDAETAQYDYDLFSEGKLTVHDITMRQRA
jgi:hypothetical protein